MNKLSGNKQTDFLIMMKLTDNELGKVCKVNKYINSLCKDDTFWMQRVHFINKYNYNDALEMKQYLNFDTWKEYYLWLDEFKKGYNFTKEEYINSDVEMYLKLLLVSLKRKHIIDETLDIYNKMELPIWINKEPFLKIMKRNLFININAEIRLTEHEELAEDNDSDLFENMIRKSLGMFQDEIAGELLENDWFEKYKESHEFVK